MHQGVTKGNFMEIFKYLKTSNHPKLNPLKREVLALSFLAEKAAHFNPRQAGGDLCKGALA